MTNRQRLRALEDVTVPVKLKLAALWTATMFLFAYGDIFTVIRAEKVREILRGEISGIEVTPAFLVAVSVYVAIPSVMVFLSLALRPRASRWTNLAVGAVYALTIIASAIGEGAAYSIFLSVVEVALVLLIVWFAWNWPRGPATASHDCLTTADANEGVLTTISQRTTGRET